MPNYIKNIVTVSEETMNKIKEKYFKMGILSFEKIIPMPKRLHLIDGYITDASIYYTWSKKSEIERNNKRCEVIINTSRPGVIIGRGGEEINKLKQTLSKLVDEEVTVSIMEVKNADLDAQLVAESIAKQIENRAPFRMAEKKAIRNAMKAGAKGIKTLVSGRLNGVEMARSEGYSEGNIPLQTIRADIDYGFAEALTTYGKLGIKVWIYKGEILPSKKVKEGGNN